MVTFQKKALLLAIPDELLHQEGLAMPGVDLVYAQAFQPFDAGMECRRIRHNGVRNRFVHIHKHIATKQVAVGCQNPDGAD